MITELIGPDSGQKSIFYRDFIKTFKIFKNLFIFHQLLQNLQRRIWSTDN